MHGHKGTEREQQVLVLRFGGCDNWRKGRWEMITINTQAEFDDYVKDGAFAVNDSVGILCDIITEASIKCRDIECGNIECGNIICGNIDCWNIKCGNIDFYAFAFAYNSFRCTGIRGRRKNSKYLCLDSEVVITGEKEGGK
jgi:hypothetical protein